MIALAIIIIVAIGIWITRPVKSKSNMSDDDQDPMYR